MTTRRASVDNAKALDAFMTTKFQIDTMLERLKALPRRPGQASFFFFDAHFNNEAVKVLPGSFGTFAGLKTDPASRVLDRDGAPIAGLYAAGSDQANVMGGHYPSGGINIGPAMTFGYLAGRHAAGVSRDENG